MNTIRTLNGTIADTTLSFDDSFAGNAYDHLATQLKVRIPDEWQSENASFYMLFQTLDQHITDSGYMSNQLELNTEDSTVSMALPQAVMRAGELRVQLRAVNTEGAIIYSAATCLKVGESIPESVSIDEQYSGLLVSTPKLRINSSTNEWEISTDYGITWSSLGVKATGEKGDTGEKGATPQITVGTVESGDTASAGITGTAEYPVLNLTLPKGDTGEPAVYWDGFPENVIVQCDAQGNMLLKNYSFYGHLYKGSVPIETSSGLSYSLSSTNILTASVFMYNDIFHIGFFNNTNVVPKDKSPDILTVDMTVDGVTYSHKTIISYIFSA